jgi:hypothetical protein
MRRKLPTPARDFILCIGDRASARALSRVTGISDRAIRRMTQHRARHYLLTELELRDLYQSWIATRSMSPRPILLGQAESDWGENQVEYLLNGYGKLPLRRIALDLGRSLQACRNQLQRNKAEVKKHHAWRISDLARAIHRPRGWVVDRITEKLLRVYHENGITYVHRDDAEYLLYFWHGRKGFPRHPGKYETEEGST